MYDYKEEAAKLVSAMTLDEKISQMLYNAKPVKRLGIPAYNWWNEALHGVARSGVATVFPQAIAMAASFDPELIKRVGEVIADEALAKFEAYQQEEDRGIYKGLTFWSPNINIFRDPRWGRGHETYGEDPFLTSRLGVAFILGLQGNDLAVLKTAACAKHYAVHSGPENERHSFDAVVDDYDLWNTYLPAFEAAVKEAHVEAVMGAYNRTNGEPCCGSKTLLQDILRDKWGFEGHVVSDCWAIMDFHQHHKITDTVAESAALAVKNGCDLNCGVAFGYCLTAVNEGLLEESDIDRAVTRLMATRMKLGLLNNPDQRRYPSVPYDVVDSDYHREINRSVARKAVVLLKNDGVLPLDASQIRTIGVIGPNADNRLSLEGNYQGKASEYVTVLDGIKRLSEEQGKRVMYAEGCHLYKDYNSDLAQSDDRMAEARAVARRADVVIVCVGLDPSLEGEEGDASNQDASGDKKTLALPGRQQVLLEQVRLAAGDKPVVVVSVSGSAINLCWADEQANAVMQVFYPGAQGGLAVAEALFGLFSPEGKLPVTFYRSDSDLPDFRDYAMSNRTYRYFRGEALYPFGYGLSYAQFSISGVSHDNGRVTATVHNEGARVGGGCTFTGAAAGTVQLYAAVEGSRENWNLCGIAKVCLKPGESQLIEITVPDTAFARYDANGDLQPCEGRKSLYIGLNQPDARSISLTGCEPVKIMVE